MPVDIIQEIMRILHTSDWHLGASDGERSLIEDQQYFIGEVCRIVKEYKADAVIIAGDVYDRSVASAEAISLYDQAMTRLCRELHTAVIVIAGNHDSAERLSSCSDLLSAAGLYVRGAASRDCTPVSFPDTDIYLLPWITEEKVKSLFPEKKGEITSLEDAYSVITEKMRETFVPGKKHILAAHAFITDSETSTSDRAAEIGFASQVSASVFEGFDYVALGHIHKPQSVTEKIRYSGTPMPYSFGKEETQEKSVTLIDTETLKQTVIPLAILHWRSTLTGTLEELVSGSCSEEVRNGYVRLHVTDSYVGPEAFFRLRNVYPNLLEASGITYEGENSSITLTMEEFEKLSENPVDVFRYFCEEETDTGANEHLISLFQEAMERVEEGEA